MKKENKTPANIINNSMRWQKKTYRRYTTAFRLKEDADIIEYLDNSLEDGKGSTEIMRRAMRLYMESEGK